MVASLASWRAARRCQIALCERRTARVTARAPGGVVAGNQRHLGPSRWLLGPARPPSAGRPRGLPATGQGRGRGPIQSAVGPLCGLSAECRIELP
jgi:hypothetical protein